MTEPAHPRLRYLAQDARTGYGDAADRLVRALRLAGAQVEYRRWAGERDPRDPVLRRHSRDPFPGETVPTGAPTVVHLVPEHYPAIRRALGDGPLVAHTVWETDRLPSHWPALLDVVERVIVPTEWNRDVFATSGTTTPIVVVPHIACDPVPGDGGAPLGLPDDVVVFYTIGRWDQRKQPIAVVRAFLDAFTGDDPVMLVVKTSAMAQHPVDGSWAHGSAMSGTTMLEVARAVREHRNPARMQVEIEAWAPDRIAGLHTRGDCFVSMSHGEGWDLAGFDACAYGNPVVMTGWGGPLEYLDGQSAYLVDCEVVPVEHWEPESYAPAQHWAMPNHDHAVELLREVARHIEVARARAAPLRERVLTDYTESRVLDTLATAVPELGLDRPIPGRDSVPRRRTPMIPRAAHFVFGLRDEPEELHLVHELAVVSCLEVVQPDEVHLHCHHEPFGPHWERIKSRVTLHHVERVAAVDALHYTDASVAHYSYAHHADIVRLEVLAEHGGLYADLDTLFIAPLPDDLWRHPFVIGREADVFVASGDALRPALSNALMLSVPGSRFVETWRSEVEGALDGSWVGHSSFLAYDLARRLPRERHVAPQRMFHAFEPSIAGIAMLLEHPPPDLQGVVSLHLNSHLWWEERRIDMSTVHAAMIDEAWIASSPSTYAACARAITAGAPPGC